MKKRGKRRGFTLLEIFVAMTILTVLLSVAMVGYRGYRDRVAVMVDQTNQKVLQASVKLFAYDNNALPGSLGDLRPHDLHRAYALVTKGKRPYTMLAHLQLMWQEAVGVDLAEAHGGFLPGNYYNRELKTVTCPSDADPPTGFTPTGQLTGGVSYGLNPAALAAAEADLRGELAWLLDPANGGEVLIIETDTPGSALRALRHGTLTGTAFSIETNVRGRSYKGNAS